VKRGLFLDEVSAELQQFSQQASVLESAQAQLQEQADGRELARMNAEELRARLSDLAHYRYLTMNLYTPYTLYPLRGSKHFM
jgi:hypothetical protein